MSVHCLLLISGITVVSLLNMRLYVPVGAVVPDRPYHRLDLPVQLLPILAPEVGLRRVYYEFHVLAVGLQDRMVRENPQVRVLVRGFGTEGRHG
jgi:hypothetical protein